MNVGEAVRRRGAGERVERVARHVNGPREREVPGQLVLEVEAARVLKPQNSKSLSVLPLAIIVTQTQLPVVERIAQLEFQSQEPANNLFHCWLLPRAKEIGRHRTLLRTQPVPLQQEQ